jgi:hypothetical protein
VTALEIKLNLRIVSQLPTLVAFGDWSTERQVHQYVLIHTYPAIAEMKLDCSRQRCYRYTKLVDLYKGLNSERGRESDIHICSYSKEFLMTSRLITQGYIGKI